MDARRTIILITGQHDILIRGSSPQSGHIESEQGTEEIRLDKLLAGFFVPYLTCLLKLTIFLRAYIFLRQLNVVEAKLGSDLAPQKGKPCLFGVKPIKLNANSVGNGKQRVVFSIDQHERESHGPSSSIVNGELSNILGVCQK